MNTTTGPALTSLGTYVANGTGNLTAALTIVVLIIATCIGGLVYGVQKAKIKTK
jgi:hypothetical protein